MYKSFVYSFERITDTSMFENKKQTFFLFYLCSIFNRLDLRNQNNTLEKIRSLHLLDLHSNAVNVIVA